MAVNKIFVTGGSGFVGSNVLKLLLQRGDCQVTVFDLKPPQGLAVDFVEGSIGDAEALARAMKGHDRVFHLAAMLGVEACQKDEALVYETNVQGTRNVLAAMEAHGIKRLLFSSSSEIYGDGQAEQFREVDVPQPKSAYGKSKVEGERLSQQFAERTGSVATVVRLFNVYGPGQREDFVMVRFCRGAISNSLLQVHGTGAQTRTFTFIDDAAKGIVAAAFAPQQRPFEIFNIGSKETVTISTLAQRIREIANSQSPLEVVPFGATQVGRNLSFEVFRRIPDVAKAARQIPFEASTSLTEGIRRTLEWVRDGKQGDGA